MIKNLFQRNKLVTDVLTKAASVEEIHKEFNDAQDKFLESADSLLKE